jgi:hypothetical protein
MPLTLGCNVTVAEARRFEELALEQDMSKSMLVKQLVLEYLEGGKYPGTNQAELSEISSKLDEAEGQLNTNKKTIAMLRGELAQAQEKATLFDKFSDSLKTQDGFIEAFTDLAERFQHKDILNSLYQKAEPTPGTSAPTPPGAEGPAEFEISEAIRLEDGSYRHFRLYSRAAGLKEPEQLSRDLLTGKEKWIDMSEPLPEEEEE